MRSINDSMLPIVWNLNDAEHPMKAGDEQRRCSPVRPLRPTHLIAFGVEGNPILDIMHNGNTLAHGVPARQFAFPDDLSAESLKEWSGPLPMRCSFESGGSIGPSDNLQVRVRGDGSIKSLALRGFGQYV